MQAGELSEDFEDLDAKLSRRHKNQRAKPIKCRPPCSIQCFDDRDQVRERLARPCPGAAYDVSSTEPVRNGSTLDFSHLEVLRLKQTILRALRER